MTKEELARQYADHKVEERNEYPCVSFQRRKELTRFDGFDIEQAYEEGFDKGENTLTNAHQSLYDAMTELMPDDYEAWEKVAFEEGFTKAIKWLQCNAWKDAQGDNLPEIDREVIVLVDYLAQKKIGGPEYHSLRVSFGHRPNPDGWDGKNIDTGEISHYQPQTYDAGGWNQPNVKYWLDIKLPKDLQQ